MNLIALSFSSAIKNNVSPVAKFVRFLSADFSSSVTNFEMPPESSSFSPTTKYARPLASLDFKKSVSLS